MRCGWASPSGWRGFIGESRFPLVSRAWQEKDKIRSGLGWFRRNLVPSTGRRQSLTGKTQLSFCPARKYDRRPYEPAHGPLWVISGRFCMSAGRPVSSNPKMPIVRFCCWAPNRASPQRIQPRPEPRWRKVSHGVRETEETERGNGPSRARNGVPCAGVRARGGGWGLGGGRWSGAPPSGCDRGCSPGHPSAWAAYVAFIAVN